MDAKQKKKATPAQMENLRKGFLALQEKRKALANKEEESVPMPPPPVAPPPVPQPPQPPVTEPPPIVPVIEKPKKERKKKTEIDLDAFRTSILSDLRSSQTERIVEKPVEKETIVYKDRVISGSALLDRIFGFN
jgi:hypothetical protein